MKKELKHALDEIKDRLRILIFVDLHDLQDASVEIIAPYIVLEKTGKATFFADDGNFYNEPVYILTLWSDRVHNETEEQIAQILNECGVGFEEDGAEFDPSSELYATAFIL